MSTDLTVIQSNTPVQFVNVRNMNLDELQKRLDDEAAAFSRFPGDALTFNGKTGAWAWGFGSKAQRINHQSMSFVFNLASAVEGWRRWTNNGIVYGPMVFLCSADRLPERETLGDTDQSLWKPDDFGNLKDPWTRYVVCPVRVDGDEKVNHLFMSGGRIPFMQLMRTFATESRRYLGKLPVVNIDRETREVRNEKGKTYEAPTFEIVDWVDPIAADCPEAADVANVDLPEADVTVTQRAEAQPEATTVDRLQNEVAAKAAAKADKTTATVQTIADKAGATTNGATGQRRSGNATAPATGNGLFIGGGQGRRRSALTPAKA